MAKRFKELADKETSKEQGKYMPSEKEEILIKKLNIFLRQARVGEDARVAMDKKGAALRAGQHWGSNASPGVTLIDSSIGVSMYEKMVDSTTRTKPQPEIFAKNSDDEDAAILLESAVLQNWDFAKLQQKIKQAALLAGFSRPPLIYAEWIPELRNGIGDINFRTIPGYRTIIDNKTAYINEMEYVGFKEKMTRRINSVCSIQTWLIKLNKLLQKVTTALSIRTRILTT